MIVQNQGQNNQVARHKNITEQDLECAELSRRIAEIKLRTNVLKGCTKIMQIYNAYPDNMDEDDKDIARGFMRYYGNKILLD